jgi:cysteinyl-tRNA synthetase
VYARNDPEALRYFLLTVHYRGPISFETEKLEGGRVIFPGVLEAERRVDYLYATLERLDALAGDATGDPPAKPPKEIAPAAALAAEAPARVSAALDDDLNTPVALSVIAEVAKAANELADLAQRRKKDAALMAAAPPLARRLATALRACLDHLGLLQTPAAAYHARTRARRLAILGRTPEDIEAKLAERTAARQAKDFARADAIRKELDALGIEVADSPTGTTWRVAPS